MSAISVIIPVYNTEEYLKECLESVCCQTFEDIEIICVNDGSTDNSLTVLQDFQKTDSRVKLISFESNRGVSAARNAGLEAALGEYILFIDSDDWIDADYIKQLVDAAEEACADLVIDSNVIEEYPGKSKPRLYVNNAFRSGFFIPCKEMLDLDKNNFSTVWCCLYRKSILNFHEIRFIDCTVHEDLYFQHEYANCVENIYVFWGKPYHRRQRWDSLIHSVNDPVLKKITVYRSLIQLYEEHGWFARDIHFLNYRYIAQNLDENSYLQLRDFTEEVCALSVTQPIVLNECDRYIIKAIRGNLPYKDFVEKYTEDIVKFYFFSKLRSNIRRSETDD